jgi:hypothetical protein
MPIGVAGKPVGNSARRTYRLDKAVTGTGRGQERCKQEEQATEGP